jgi:hypothetical protein
MNMKGTGKIFCIGLPKTATTSLHVALEMLGFRSLHHGEGYGVKLTAEQLTKHLESARAIRELIRGNIAKRIAPLEGLDGYDAYADIGPLTRRFDVFDKFYPGSRFIWTERSDKDWVSSRIKHTLRGTRRRLLKESGPEPKENLDPDTLIAQKHQQFDAVRRYFSDRPQDLLVIDICAGQGFELLCPFLKIPVPSQPFPWANQARSLGRRNDEAEQQHKAAAGAARTRKKTPQAGGDA